MSGEIFGLGAGLTPLNWTGDLLTGVDEDDLGDPVPPLAEVAEEYFPPLEQQEPPSQLPPSSGPERSYRQIGPFTAHKFSWKKEKCPHQVQTGQIFYPTGGRRAGGFRSGYELGLPSGTFEFDITIPTGHEPNGSMTLVYENDPPLNGSEKNPLVEVSLRKENLIHIRLDQAAMRVLRTRSPRGGGVSFRLVLTVGGCRFSKRFFLAVPLNQPPPPPLIPQAPLKETGLLETVQVGRQIRLPKSRPPQ